MSTHVPPRPTPSTLRRLGIARPVYSSHGLRWGDMLAYLLAHNVQAIYSGYLGAQAASTGVFVAYNPRAHAKVLYLALEMLDATTTPASATVALTVGGAGATLIGRSVLNGSDAVPSPRAGRRSREVYDAFIDASGLTAGTTIDIGVAWTNVTNSKGIARVHLFEVPLADVDPTGAPATEPGVIVGAWPDPTNLLCDSSPGVTSLGYGFPRILAGLDLARASWRMHRQLVTPENTTGAIQTTSAAFAALTWPMIAGGYDPVFRLRARRLYTTSISELATLRIRYRTAAGGDTATFRATVNGSNTDIVLGGTTTWTVATAALSIPTSTSEQLVDCTFAGKTSGTLYVSQVATIGAET